MKSQWDIKSILLGTAIGAAGLALLGAEAPSPAPAAPVGRFQVTAASAGGGYGIAGYVVDTVTGEVWTSSKDGFRDAKIK